jgi:hypothetical protein
MKKHLTIALALLTLICTSAQAQLPSYLPADGLVGWWPFNGNANDESGNGNDGVFFLGSNGTISFIDDRNGIASSSIDFNSISSFNTLGPYITLSNSQNFLTTPSYTLNYFLKISASNVVGELFNKGADNATGAFINRINQGTLQAFIGGYAPGLNADVEAGVWKMITLSRESNSTMRLYVNGVLFDEFTNSGSVSSNSPLNIGAMVSGGTNGSYYPYQGTLDDIAIYNRALTSQEIQNLYTGTTPAACLDLPANLQDGLVGYWPFCGNANDESGNGNNGTVNGATLAEDRFGNAGSAYGFDGVDDYVEVLENSVLKPTEQISLSAWIKIDQDLSENFARIINKELDSYPSYGSYQLITGNFGLGQGGDLGFTIRTSNGYSWSGLTGNSFINEWVHVIGVYDGVSLKCYHNGQEVANVNQTGSIQYSNSNIDFGRSTNTNGVSGLTTFFKGLIDDITIYNRALSPEEVTQLYAVQSTGDPTAGGGGNTTGPLANVPRGISYQAVARDAQGQAIASTPVNVRFTLHQGTPSGTTEYSETHALTTNEIGLFNTYFGSGTAITSAFDSIVWSNTTKFLQVEIDLGNSYVDMGTQQLMSVPFAYRAKEAAAAGTIRNNALPVFPDNTAALAGGLMAGEMYRTATGDLKVVY